MKPLWPLAFVILIISFSHCRYKPEYFHGYVYDQEGDFVSNVKISFSELPNVYFYTDATGFFRFKFEKFYPNLIFEKEGYITDTVPTVWIQHGERAIYLFTNKYPDTIYLSKIPCSAILHRQPRYPAPCLSSQKFSACKRYLIALRFFLRKAITLNRSSNWGRA